MVYNIPDFLEEQFTNMSDEDISVAITKALLKADSVVDRVCLDMRLEQKLNFGKILNRLVELENKMQSGVVVSSGGGMSSSSISSTVEVKEEKYVSMNLEDDDEDDMDFGDFIM